MKEGDVYFWQWKPGDLPGHMPYHGWAQIAVVGPDGRLRDTFWGDMSNNLVPLERVDLTYRGNIHEMRKIHRYEKQFYRTEDCVDVSYANNRGAHVHVVPGAVRDQGVMRELTLRRISDAHVEIRAQERKIEHLTAELSAIDAGRLDEVTPR